MIKISGFTDEISSNLDEQIKVLNELGEQYMCPRKINKKSVAEYTAAEFDADVKPVLNKNGIKFSSIGSPIGKVGINDEEGYQRQLVQLKELVKIAQSMDCRYIRTFSFFVEPDCDYDALLPRVVEKINGFLKCVEGTDVVLLHENEKKIWADVPDRVIALYKAVNNPQYQLCFDASNYIQCGADPWTAYKTVKPFTVYYHMKDCLDGIEVPLGTGQGRIADILRDLISGGYDGFLTLEPHTFKYALLKRAVYVLPPVGKLKTARRVYKKIDKDYNIKSFEKVSRKQVYLWQYQNLKNLIEEG